MRTNQLRRGVKPTSMSDQLSRTDKPSLVLLPEVHWTFVSPQGKSPVPSISFTSKVVKSQFTQFHDAVASSVLGTDLLESLSHENLPVFLYPVFYRASNLVRTYPILVPFACLLAFLSSNLLVLTEMRGGNHSSDTLQ